MKKNVLGTRRKFNLFSSSPCELALHQFGLVYLLRLGKVTEVLHPCTTVTLIHKHLHKKEKCTDKNVFRKLDQLKCF